MLTHTIVMSPFAETKFFETVSFYFLVGVGYTDENAFIIIITIIFIYCSWADAPGSGYTHVHKHELGN